MFRPLLIAVAFLFVMFSNGLNHKFLSTNQLVVKSPKFSLRNTLNASGIYSIDSWGYTHSIFWYQSDFLNNFIMTIGDYNTKTFVEGWWMYPNTSYFINVSSLSLERKCYPVSWSYNEQMIGYENMTKTESGVILKSYNTTIFDLYSGFVQDIAGPLAITMIVNNQTGVPVIWNNIIPSYGINYVDTLSFDTIILDEPDQSIWILPAECSVLKN